MGMNTNVSYEQLLKMTETIKKAESLREIVAEKEALIARLESVKIDYTYHDLPYKKAVDALEARSNEDTFLQKFRSFFYTLIIALIFGAIPTLIVSVLESQDLMIAAIEAYALYIGLGLSFVVFVIAFKVVYKKIKHRVHNMYKKRILRRGQKKLLQVKHTAEKMADAYESQIKDKLRVLKRALEESFTNLKGHERKLMQDALVPEHMLPRLPDIAEYIIDHRAESIKEAINLMVKEEREQFYFERLLYGLRNQDVPLEKVLDKNHNIEEAEEAEDVVGPMLQRADDLSQPQLDEDVLGFVSVKEEDFVEKEKNATLEEKMKAKSDKLEGFEEDKEAVETKSILEPTPAKKSVATPLQKTVSKDAKATHQDKASEPVEPQKKAADDTFEGVPLEEEFELPEASTPIKVETKKPKADKNKPENTKKADKEKRKKEKKIKPEKPKKEKSEKPKKSKKADQSEKPKEATVEDSSTGNETPSTKNDADIKSKKDTEDKG